MKSQLVFGAILVVSACAPPPDAPADEEEVAVGDCVSCEHRVDARISLPERPSADAEFVYVQVLSDPLPDRVSSPRELPPPTNPWPASIPLSASWYSDRVPPTTLTVGLALTEGGSPFWVSQYEPQYLTVEDECNSAQTCEWSRGPDLTADW